MASLKFALLVCHRFVKSDHDDKGGNRGIGFGFTNLREV